MKNKISILLAVYNGGGYVKEAIESILNQTYQNWELIVVSNGSTDNTQQVIEELQAIDDRIQVYNVNQKGKNRAYNFAFSRSSGNIICFFAADDVLPPNSLVKRSQVLAADKSFSTCCLKTFSDNSIRDGIIFPKNLTQPNYSGGSIMFTRHLAEKIFPIPEGQPNEDTWSSLHLRAFGTNFHIAEPLYFYRIHSDNSFGYDLTFEEKRSKYLQRMVAFDLFYERYRAENIEFIDEEVVPFLKGLKLVSMKKIFPILFIEGLSLKHKMVLIYYCSPTLFNIRYKYFKYLSGIFN